METENKHSPYSPSQLSRIMACPASVRVIDEITQELKLKGRENALEEEQSPYAAEGTMLHEAMYKGFSGDPDGKGWTAADVGITDIDHADAIALARDYVLKYLTDEQGQRKRVRMRMEEHVVVPGCEMINGTADVILHDKDTNEVHVIDYKFGKGVKVEATNNPQLLAYLSGAVHLLVTQKGIMLPHDAKLFVHICQPRIDNYDVWQVSWRELADFEDECLNLVKEDAYNSEPVPGKEQCQWCKARGMCAARINHVGEKKREAFSKYADILINKNTMDLAALERILEERDEVETMYKHIEQTLFQLAMAGEQLTKYKLVQGRSIRAWAPEASYDSLLERFPELNDRADDLLEVKLISPAKCEKLLSKESRKAMNDEFVRVPEGKLTLAHISSAKPEASRIDGISKFAD